VRPSAIEAPAGGVLVSATDTGVGKTILAACLLAAAAASGRPVRAHKPVVTGLDEPAGPWPPDHVLLARVTGQDAAEVCGRTFGPPASPHLAAALAGSPLTGGELLDDARAAVAATPAGGVLVVEGVGGLLVPLAEDLTVRDLALALGLPIVLAARPGLGTINHTLLSLEAARAAGLTVAAVVLTPWPAAPDAVMSSGRETIERAGRVPVHVLGEVADEDGLAAAGATLPWEAWLGPLGHDPAHPGEPLEGLDHRLLWHPFTPQEVWTGESPLLVERAQGTTLYGTDGRGYIDGVSSLWCNVHGHRHPHIDAAVRAQLGRVAHSTMLGLSHPPGVRLAERLLAIAPPGLTRVFYSDNGSTAVEIALKMAFQWWCQQGDPPTRSRTGFVHLRDSYHGDTVGSVSVGGISLFHAVYGPLLFEAWAAEPGDAGDMDAVLRAHEGQVAAVIVEPLVQGAAGMIVHPDGYLRAVRELCDSRGVPLICDEVAVGFGRTGTMFACEHEGVAPDLMCVAKGLTGGYLPLAATLATERIYEGFLGRPEEQRTFFHGHTFTGNPLACAAALASLEVFEQEGTLARLQRSIALLAELLGELVAVLPGVLEIRRRGFMCAIELAPAPGEPAGARGRRVTQGARERGAVVRPLGDAMILMPPLSISDGELRRLVEIVAAAIGNG
jgi:adenosylmethionine-8-amino-7-oxononanoate aminotransferase